MGGQFSDVVAVPYLLAHFTVLLGYLCNALVSKAYHTGLIWLCQGTHFANIRLSCQGSVHSLS